MVGKMKPSNKIKQISCLGDSVYIITRKSKRFHHVMVKKNCLWSSVKLFFLAGGFSIEQIIEDINVKVVGWVK